MKSMEVRFGVIRDKQGIRAGLLQNKSSGNQLAVCYNDDGKLLVKICHVLDVPAAGNGPVIMRLDPDDSTTEFKVGFEEIQSIYPITEFHRNV
jgi:hypothetical protein